MSILITGASGSICQKLSVKLKEQNYQVKFLTANLNKTSTKQNIFYWDIKKGHIDEAAFEGIEVIVHLAGAGIANSSWTKERKEELRSSRIDSARLIYTYLQKLNKSIKKYISASAIGFYPDGVMNGNEQQSPGNDFMSNLCVDWEKTLSSFNEDGIQTVAMRTGIVIDIHSGFYTQIAKLANFYVAAVPGSGKQWVSWISMNDMVNMYYNAIVDDSVEGIYNATSANPEMLENVIKAICKNENKPLFLPNIPEFVLKLLYGEMAQVILSSKHVVPSKWLSEGRTFQHPTLLSAIENK